MKIRDGSLVIGRWPLVPSALHNRSSYPYRRLPKCVPGRVVQRSQLSGIRLKHIRCIHIRLWYSLEAEPQTAGPESRSSSLQL